MAHRGISKLRQKPGTLNVDPAAAFFDDLMNRPSLDSTPYEQPFSLGLPILLVLPGGNSGRDGHFSGNVVVLLWLFDNHGFAWQLVACDLASLPHSPGCGIANPLLLRVDRQLHTTRIAHLFNLRKRCLYWETSGSILKNQVKYLNRVRNELPIYK
jgi:hypothetical protein